MYFARLIKYYIKLPYTRIKVLLDKGDVYHDTLIFDQQYHDKSSNTILIFSHFDKDDIIDDYVIYYLSEINKLHFDIMFISTSAGLSEHELYKVSSLCKHVIVKQNIGYDFGAWKTGVTLLTKTLYQYEQLILCNDSVYAPLCDLKEMFTKMHIYQYDFWGITDNYKYGHHIQSYFMVFSKNVFLQSYFKEFWNNIRVHKWKQSIILNYEIGLTKLLRKHKHSYGAYCPSIPKNLKNSTQYGWKDLIVLQQSPIIKIELLRSNPDKVNINDWDEFLKQNTPYNIELIQKHLARVKEPI